MKYFGYPSHKPIEREFAYNGGMASVITLDPKDAHPQISEMLGGLGYMLRVTPVHHSSDNFSRIKERLKRQLTKNNLVEQLDLTYDDPRAAFAVYGGSRDSIGQLRVIEYAHFDRQEATARIYVPAAFADDTPSVDKLGGLDDRALGVPDEELKLAVSVLLAAR